MNTSKHTPGPWRVMSYAVTTYYPEGFSHTAYDLTLAAAQYFRRLALTAGADSVTIAPTY